MVSSPSRRGTSRDMANGGSSSANAGKDLKDSFVLASITPPRLMLNGGGE